MSSETFKRINYYDGHNITQEDLVTEQSAWHDTIASGVDFLAGSGVEKEFAVQRLLFDTSDVPTSISTLLTNEIFDGEPIYETDNDSATCFLQPSDSSEGAQLEVVMSGASLTGAHKSRVYIFGTTFGDEFTQECLTFDDNESQVTRTYFTSIIAITTQDFRGNSNIVTTGTACRNTEGRLRIYEATPMFVCRDHIMSQQAEEPNMDYRDFRPADQSKTLYNVLNDIANQDNRSTDDLGINVTSTATRKLEPNVSGFIVGQKFKATTNNIQKVTILLSVDQNTLAPVGTQYDWSGDLIVGVRKLQTTTQCPTDITPGTSIEFDPEQTALAEISVDQDSLEEIGIVLDGVPQEVDFVFTQSLIANPALEPNIEIGSYYMVTVQRSGDTSNGTIILEEAANTDAGVNDTDEKRLSIYSNSTWTDVPESDLWFKVFTNAIRITSGMALDEGVQIISPRTQENSSTGLSESYINGNYSLVDTSATSYNYVIAQKQNNYITPVSHPTTGNQVYSRIEDIPAISVVSESNLETLVDAENETIILAAVKDNNPTGIADVSEVTYFPGLADGNTFTIIAPVSDIINNNLVGSILTPNINKSGYQYKIVKQENYIDAYGDVDGSGTIDSSDVLRAQQLDGYGNDLQVGTLSSTTQYNAVVAQKTVTMAEILRADVNGTGYVSQTDAALIQQYINIGSAFPAGSTFNRTVLTVESLTDPLTTTVDIDGNDPSFNDSPFTPLTYNIEFIENWYPENLEITDLRRFVSKTFTSIESSDFTGTTKTGGSNTTFVPGDMSIGGRILDLDGNSYSPDLEVCTIILSLSDGATAGEIDIFNNFIRNTMKFADGTYVGSSALEDGQVFVSSAIQSYVKNLGVGDGYDFYTGADDGIDEMIAILYTQSTGILRIRAANVRNISTRPELSTKIALTVYLKKAGFQNSSVTKSASETDDLLVPI